MRALKYLVLLAMLGALGTTGCRNDDDEPCCDPTNPECPNYDPCWNQYPTADFKMRQTSPGFVIPDHLQAEWCDTILGSGVEFLADMEGALSYTWQIGSESQTRPGRNLKISFQSYIADPISLNPENPDYRNPLPITLTVRNTPGACVNESDTVLTITRLLVLTSRSLTSGIFRGRVEGENFDRDVVLWQEAGDLSHPNYIYWYVSQHIGLPFKDTLKMFVPSPLSMVTSYKQIRWDEDWHNYSTSRDGVRKWNQQITISAGGPDKVDLYFERIPEDNSGLQTVKFSGYRIE